MTTLPLDFSKGLFAIDEDSVLPSGTLAELTNWEPRLNGGLRHRESWSTGMAGVPSPKFGGFAWSPILATVGGTDGSLIYAKDAGTKYTLYGWEVASPGQYDSLGDISETATFPVLIVPGRTHSVIAGWSLSKLYTVNYAGVISSSGATAIPQNSRALAFHFDAYWAGGGKDTTGADAHSLLMWTDPGGLPLSAWPSGNSTYVGRSDNDSIMGLFEYQDILVVGKQHGLWIVTGTPPDLDIHKLSAGECSPGQPMVSTPYGLVVAGQVGVYLFDGGSSVENIAVPLGTLYAPGSYAHTAFFDNKLYVATGGVVYVFDFLTQAWFIEDTNATANGAISALATNLVTLYGAQSQATYASVSRQRGQRDADVLVRTHSLKTPEYRVGAPGFPAVFRALHLQLRQRGGSVAGPGLSVTTTIRQEDGTIAQDTQIVDPRVLEGQSEAVFHKRIDLPGSGFGVQFEVEQVLATQQRPGFDIEAASLTYDLGTER